MDDNTNNLRERRLNDDWGLFHQQAASFFLRLVIVAMFGTFISGFVSQFNSIYALLAALILFAGSAATIGYDIACAQIGKFASNAYALGDGKNLLASTAPINFNEKYGYRSGATGAAIKLYCGLIIASFWPLTFFAVSGFAGIYLGRLFFG